MVIKELIKDWKDLLEYASNGLKKISEEEAKKKESELKWSKKEILGHLCDSAINNYSRVIKIQLSNTPFQMDRYAQNDWVRLADYQSRKWDDVIFQWHILNSAFINVVQNTPDIAFNKLAEFEGQSLSLEFIVTDYVVHMKHHLNQIGIPVLLNV